MSTENNAWRWSAGGWTAQVVENEDGGGWALEMTADGSSEPTLVVPWVTGRNKKDPKPLNDADFRAQAKAAQDFLTRAEHQRKSHQVSFGVTDAEGEWVRVVCEVSADEYDPSAELVALTRAGDELARAPWPLGQKFSRDVAQAWVQGGFQALRE